MYEQIFQDLKSITEVWELFTKNEPSLSLKNPAIGSKIEEKDCIELGYQSFVNRFGYAARSVDILLRNNGSNFRTTEFAVSLLLRSCLLDCIMVYAWVKDHNLISIYMSESFKKIPENKFIPKGKLDFYKVLGNWFNFKDLKEVRTRELIASVGKEDFIIACESLYSFYSKYDHFSPIPFVDPISIEENVANVKYALLLIRGAMWFLFEEFCSDNSAASEYQRLLNINFPNRPKSEYPEFYK